MTRNDAITLMKEWIANPALQTHCIGVGISMKHYATIYGEDGELWETTGILHDLDWEKYPEVHPDKAVAYFKEINESPEMIKAIHGHKYTDTIETLIDKALFACDELSGFVYACILVRPGKTIDGMEVSSVKKKIKDKRFAEAVSRDDIIKGAELLGIPLEEHIQNVITAYKENRELLGV